MIDPVISYNPMLMFNGQPQQQEMMRQLQLLLGGLGQQVPINVQPQPTTQRPLLDNSIARGLGGM